MCYEIVDHCQICEISLVCFPEVGQLRLALVRNFWVDAVDVCEREGVCERFCSLDYYFGEDCLGDLLSVHGGVGQICA